MIGVVIECRLGNQLFQYAFIMALARKLNTSAFIQDKQEAFLLPDFFDLDGYGASSNMIKRILFKLKGNPLKSLQSIGIHAVGDDLFMQPKNDTIYSGYFQSELFFKNIAGNIRKYIRVKRKYRDAFKAKFGDLFEKNRIIAVHIRRGDYLNLNDWWVENFGSHDLTLPDDYYLQSILQVKDYEKYRLIFVSDDIAYVKSAFGQFSNADFISGEMIMDFQVLMNADVCITSNSSFSWWAAYLNDKTHKQVICPKYWLGFKVKREYPEHIIPGGWTQVEPNNSLSRDLEQ